MMKPLLDIQKDACFVLGDENEVKLPWFQRRSPYVMQELAACGDTGSTVTDAILRRDPVTRVIYLPEDFVQPLKVGFIFNGNFIGFGHNPKMQPALPDSCGNPIPIVGGNSKGVPAGMENAPPGYDLAWLDAQIPYYGGWAWGEAGMRWFGAAAGWSDGYYRFDAQSHVLQFSSEVRIDEVWVRYKTTGMSSDKPTLVYSQWANAILHGLLRDYWTFNQKDNKDRANYETHKHEFALAKAKAIALTHGSTLAEMVDVHRQTSGGAVRR